MNNCSLPPLLTEQRRLPPPDPGHVGEAQVHLAAAAVPRVHSIRRRYGNGGRTTTAELFAFAAAAAMSHSCTLKMEERSCGHHLKQADNHAGSSKKNFAKFCHTCSVRADGLFIGCLGHWAERGREDSNMHEIFCSTLYP